MFGGRISRARRNAASLLDEAEAAEAAEEAALDELGLLKRAHAECTRKMERMEKKIERLSSSNTRKDAEIEKLKASLDFHTTLQEYHRAQSSSRVAESNEKQDSRKTALCKYFQLPSGCSRGNDCPFAHGSADLRVDPMSDPRFKTKLCQQWEHTGRCEYHERGSICHFAHGKQELREGGDIHFSVFVTPSKLKTPDIEELLTLFSSYGELVASDPRLGHKPVHPLETGGYFVNYRKFEGAERIMMESKKSKNWALSFGGQLESVKPAHNTKFVFELAQHFQDISFDTCNIMPSDERFLKLAISVAEGMTGKSSWRPKTSNIPSILALVPVEFWMIRHDRSSYAVPDFKGLPYAKEAYVRYDGVLDDQEMSSFCAAGYFLWHHDAVESEVYVLMVKENREDEGELGFIGGKRDSSKETPW